MNTLAQEVREILKGNMWLIISTVDKYNNPHSCVVVYQSDGEDIYIQTGASTLKAKNIKYNNNVSITIPFRKNLIHKLIPAPPAELHFTATAEIISKDNKKARKVLKKFIKAAENVKNEDEKIWIKIIPSKTICTYGVGVSLLSMKKPEKARNKIHLDS